MFGQLPPWLSGLMGQQGMQSGMQQPVPMTPGAGMPPSQAPGGPSAMGPMQPPGQMQPPRGGPPQPQQMPQQGQGKGPMNPAQMAMLAQALQGQTQQPRWDQISPEAMEGVIPGTSGADAKSYMQGLAPDPKPQIPWWMMGQMFPGQGGGF